MAQSTKAEKRYLSAEEFDFVARSHYPALRHLDDGDLSSLIAWLRERRDRAAGIAHRQRREMRGKARPAGTRPAADDTGTQHKRQILAAAVKRANKERERRRTAQARDAQVAYARKALAMKKAAGAGRSHRPDPGHTPGEGMPALPNERGADLVRPMEVGRVSQFVKAAQARRDSK